MADETTPSTGFSTSEGKLTLVAVIVGTILDAVAGVLDSLQSAGHGATWFPSVLAVCGVLLQLVSLLGYQKARTLFKVGVAPAALSSPK